MNAIERLKKAMLFFAMAGLGVLISCSEENVALQEEAELITEDAITDVYFEDVDDIAGLALLSDDGTDNGGRVAESRTIIIQDSRCNCESVVVTITIDPQSTPEKPIGDIVIDFGEGCTDALGNVRKGKILIHFEGRRFLPGSTVVTIFDNYSINDIQLSGTRTLTNITESSVSAPKFQIQLENGKAVWPDGSEATREHCLVRTWIRAVNPLNDAMVIEQCDGADVAASGTNRRGKSYTMSILEPLVYKRGCPIAVEGVKQFVDVASGKVILVNYGEGDCDRSITISVDGNSRTVNVNKKG
jgi:hypothetical protein